MRSIWIGYDPREAEAFAVARLSINNLTQQIPVRGLSLSALRKAGLYTRPTEMRQRRLYDVISQHPMATEFAISRFLVPHMAGSGWALFADCDILVRRNLERLFDKALGNYAVMCVKHNHVPENTTKMDDQVQAQYARKNWSSVMLFNCDHPSNKKLTPELVNSVPGRDLHRFCWLKDEEIGELSVEWNWLCGTSEPSIDPGIVHYTDGGPWFDGFKDVPYADEWRMWRERWVA